MSHRFGFVLRSVCTSSFGFCTSHLKSTKGAPCRNMVSSLAQTLQVALLLSAPAVWASPVLLDRRQAESNSSAASSSATGSSSENSSTSASSTGVPESIASAASSFQSSAPSPTGSADGQGVSSARYPYTCPDDYLLTYAFNQISLEQTVEELLPVVNWTNPR